MECKKKSVAILAFDQVRLQSTMPFIIFHNETPLKSQEKVAKIVKPCEENYQQHLEKQLPRERESCDSD